MFFFLIICILNLFSINILPLNRKFKTFKMLIYKFKHIFLLILILSFIKINVFSQNPSSSTAWKRANAMGSGVNLEHWLEGNQPNTDYINENDFALIKSLGFSYIRLCVNFSKASDTIAPYNCDTTIFNIADSALLWCEQNDLKIIIDNHNGRMEEVGVIAEKPRLIAIWKQISERYKTTDPEKVFFELYNEPVLAYNLIEMAEWNSLSKVLADTIHSIAPNHSLIIGPALGNTIYGLLVFGDYGPIQDTNIIYTFHFYEPGLFTHQGANWLEPYYLTSGFSFPYNGDMPPIDSLEGCESDFMCNYQYLNYPQTATDSSIISIFSSVKNWSLQHNVPIFCGEYGAYYQADIESRLRWNRVVSCTLDSLQIPWAHWGWKNGRNSFGFINGLDANTDSIIPDYINSLCINNLDYGIAEYFQFQYPQLQVYPNPINSHFYINDIENKFANSKLCLYSCFGELVYEESFNSQKSIDVSNVKPGVYFGELSNTDLMNKAVFKIIVIH